MKIKLRRFLVLGVFTAACLYGQGVAIDQNNVPSNGEVGVLYNGGDGFVFSANPSGSLTWSAPQPTLLPPGLTLDTTGLLGANQTPTTAGTYTFPVQVTAFCSTCSAPPTDTQTFTMQVFAPLQITSPSQLPAATSLQPYSFQLTAQGGDSQYLEWSINSGFARQGSFGGTAIAPSALRLQPRAQCSTGYGVPPGLCLTSGGSLQGTPTRPGNYNFYVLVYDGDIQNYAFQAVSITILPPGSGFSLSGPLNLGTFLLGSAVSGALNVNGGTPPYTYTLTPLPAGMTSSASAISGTPTVPGTDSVGIKVTDSAGLTATSSINFSVFGISSTALPNGVVSSPYSYTIEAAGGQPPYTFTATGLPPHFSFPPNGNLNGTPAASGNFNVAVTVEDANGLTYSKSFPLAINPPGPLSLNGGALSDATVFVPSYQTLSATGGAPPYTWTLAGGSFPDGLTLRSSGTIAGTPDKPGSYTFSARATDVSGGSGVGVFTMNVTPQPVTILTPSPLSSGMVTVDYPLQVLTATGGSGSYTFTADPQSLPPGLTLAADGLLSGTPTATGDFTFTVTATDANSQTGTASLAIKVRPFSPDLMLSVGSVAFSMAAGSTQVPSFDAVQVQSTDVTKILGYSVAITGAPSWLSVAGAGVSTGGATPGSFRVALTNTALSLASSPTPYQAQIVVTCLAPSPCAGSAQTVNVTLTVKSLPPLLSLDTNLLSFTTSPTSPVAVSETIGATNSGGGSIGFASVTCSADWCHVGAVPAGLGGGASGDIHITAEPGGLNPGFYYANLTIVSSIGTTTVPVQFFIAPNATLALSPGGIQLQMQQGGVVAVPEGDVDVSVSGSTPIAWTAAVLPGAPWLRLADTSGTSTGSAPGMFDFSIDQTAAAALSAGSYYGTIRVTAPNAVDSPQDFQVVLNVAAVDKTKPQPTPGGLLFITTANGAPPPQTDVIFASSADPVNYQASVATEDGGNWLRVAKTSGVTSQPTPARASISVNPSGLNPGTYRGTATYSFSASGVRSVNVTLIVLPPALAPSDKVPGSLTPKAQGACAPAKLVPTQTGLVSNFAAPAAFPTPLEITLSDDCGNVVPTGQVVATFSNGDPPLAFALSDPVAAKYTATWTPRKSSSQVTVNARASAAGLADGTTQIAGSVVPNVSPVLTPNGTLHVFTPLVGAPLAPGTIVQIYGSQLANKTLAGTTIPLATSLAGTSVIIGGVPAPLYFVSPGQINAQLPFELTPGQPYQIIVSNNGALTTPNTIAVANVTPGVAALASGAANAQHVADGSLITEASPAKPGEYIVLYLAGMGATSVPVATGSASPSSPLATTQSTPTATLNGEPVNVVFSGLTPGLAGLYQVDLQIPADAPNGDLNLVVTQPGFDGTTVLLPVHN